MSIQGVGLKAYTKALNNFARAERKILANQLPTVKPEVVDFKNILADSIEKVNNLQTERSSMIQSFASGESQNVHELMISMQKASLAMNMTSAVRNKVLEAYRELTRMQF